MKKYILCSFLLGLTATASAGYLAIAESGEIIPKDTYYVSVLPQIRTSDGSGANIDVAFDAGLSEAMSIRAQAGAGKIDFHGGASIKFVPFPDIENQPAMGFKAAAWYARAANENFLTLQVAPLVSRRFGAEYGLFVPYLAVPINMTNTKDKTTTGMQITIGSELRNTDWKNAILTSEIALNLNDSFSAITFGISFPFDQARGFKR